MNSAIQGQVQREVLDPDSQEYKEVAGLFIRTSGNRLFQIIQIEKVNNHYLKKKFDSKYQEYLDTYGVARIVKAFHGTPSKNIASILENNFDIKKTGTHIGHRFGAGISFSAMSSYAGHYCEKSEINKTMLLCEVLIGNMISVPECKFGNCPTQPPILPNQDPGCNNPLRYDTTAKSMYTMDVIVKYESDSFYPAYVITFQKYINFTLI